MPAPSVITMNMMSTSLALNDFLFMFAGLHVSEDLGPRSYHFLTRDRFLELRDAVLDAVVDEELVGNVFVLAVEGIVSGRKS